MFKKLSISFFMLGLSLQAVAVELEKAWETEAIFAAPESVIYDQKRDVMYVSNVNEHGFKHLGNGYISKMSTDGKMLDQYWVMGGLDAPKGLTIFEDTLYATDINALISIDINTGKIIKRYEAADAAHLNDVAVDEKGRVYVADTLTDSIYKLNEIDLFFRWLTTPDLEAPNGLHAEGENLIVGSWGHPTDGFVSKVPGHLKKLSLVNKQVTSLGNGQSVGNLDGVEADGHGNYYVTDWIAGKLLLIKPDGSSEALVTLTPGAADLEVILAKNLIIVPLMQDNKVVAFKIK